MIPYTSSASRSCGCTDLSLPGAQAPYLGTQLGDDRSTSQVAYRFMCTGRLEVIATGLEGCGDGTPPVLGSPPRSDILEVPYV